MRRKIRVMLGSRLSIGLLVCGAVGAGSLGAQATDTAVRGVVEDSTGAPLAGALVELVHQASGRRFGVTANQRGRFALRQLPLGPYHATARRVGFRSVEQRDLVLVLGDQRDLRFVLPAAPLELVPLVVEGGQGARRDDRIGGSVRIDTTQLASLPTVNRNFSDLAALSPLAGPQLSLGGQRYTSTGYRLDGVQARNLFRAGEYNAGPQAVPLEAIREFEVNTNVYDVTQGRQGGGEIAAVTRSGTNRWRVSGFSAYRSEALGAAADYQGRPRSARPFTTVQWGGVTSGPLVRDRAHFFAAVERQDGTAPLLVGLLDTPEAERAAGIAKDSLSRILAVLSSQYGTVNAAGQVGRLPRAPTATSLFGRIDWSLSPSHSLTLRHSASHWDNPLSGGVDQPIALREARSGFSSDEQQGLATLGSTLSAALHNELRLGVSRSSRRLVPESPGIPRGFVQVRSALPGGAAGNTTVQFGGNRLAPDQSREWQLQLVDRLFAQWGPALLTVGFDHSLAGFSTLIAESQAGLFVFPSIAALETRQPSRFARTVPVSGPSPATSLTLLDLSGFAQAEWRGSPHLTLLAGLRWDASAMISTPARNPLVEAELGLRTDRRAADWRTFSPRAQLVWNRAGDGRDMVRAGGGLFSAALPAYAFHNLLLNTGLSLVDIDLRGAAVPAPDYPSYRADPGAVPGLPAGAPEPPSYVNVLGSTFRSPTMWKTSLSYQRRVARWLTATVSGMSAWGRGGYHYVDANLRAAPAFTLENEGGRGVYVPASTIPAVSGLTDVRNATVSAQLGRVLALESLGESRQYGATVELTARPPNRRVQLDIAYAWSHARDNSTFGCCLGRTATTFTAIGTDPRDLTSSWGPADFDIRHRLVVSGIVALPGAVGLSGRLIASSGRPFSLVVDGDLNGDESNGNDLAFIFDPADPTTPAEVAASMRRILANRDNVTHEYLREHLGQLAGRNLLRTPGTARLDLRVTKDIRLRGQSRMGLIVDLFNALNLIDHDWGSEPMLPPGISTQNPVVNRIPLLRIIGFDPTTQRFRYAVNEQAGVLPRGGDPYQLQIGLRLEH